MKILEIDLETIDSTNSYAKNNHEMLFAKMKAAHADILCITAETQTAGRGRNQRSWVSPPKVNIYATFCFRMPRETRNLSTLAQLMACSLCSVLEQEGFHPKIKWPNDIQLSGKKVAGILCELVFSQLSAEIFLGLGVNVNMSSSTFEQIDQPATSLKEETKKIWDRQKLLKMIQSQLGTDLLLFQKEGFAPFRKKMEDRLARLGEKIQCNDGKKIWEGICHSIAEDGRLNLLLADGTIQPIFSADIL